MLRRALPKICRSRAVAFAIGFALSTAVAYPWMPARADDLIVKYDQSQILKLPRPVSEIIIGNPTIAEITVHSSNTLVVTGKTFGITNVIALDAERNVIQDQRVMVVRDEGKVVSLQKGGKRESYNCTPQCNPSLVIGDDPSYFETVSRLAERKMKFSDGGGDANQGAQ